VPKLTWRSPSETTIEAKQIEATISMAASCSASYLIDAVLASRYAALMLSNSVSAAASRPNACTIAMPDTCSFMLAFICAVLARMARNASRERPRTSTTSSPTSGAAAKLAMPNIKHGVAELADATGGRHLARPGSRSESQRF